MEARRRHDLGIRLKRHWRMYVFALLPLVYLVIFKGKAYLVLHVS